VAVVFQFGIQNFCGNFMNILELGKDVFQKEILSAQIVRDHLGESFTRIVAAIGACTGKVVFIGMGKPGHVGAKLAATFSSLGIPSFFVHPGEAMHGDLGMISKNDLVFIISYSGESYEIVSILPNIRRIGSKIIGLTANEDSFLAKYSDICEVLPKFEEACRLGLAPTSSTTVEMIYGDALAVTISTLRNFSKTDFGLYHPGGSLGKSLIIKTKDLMISGEANPTIRDNVLLKDAIILMGQKGGSLISVVDDRNVLLGVITDGIITKALSSHKDIYSYPISSIYLRDPISINEDSMAIEALKIMNENNIKQMPVLRDDICVGLILKSDILKFGIYVK
jgi:arabinose-5-phosphate isomerase